MSLASTNFHLLIHNVAFMAGGVLNFVLPLVVLYIRRKNLTSMIVTFWLVSWAAAVFQIFQVLGANAANANLSRQLFMFNMTDIWIGAFVTHWFLAVIGKDKDPKERRILAVSYGVAVVIFTIGLVQPRLFLLDSVPKLYLPFYYNPGPLYYVMVVYFFIGQTYYFAKLIGAYRHETDSVLKNRYRYMLIAMLYAYATGQLAFLLVFNIPVDPMWASFTGLYPLILAYAMVKYQLMDVKLIIQRAAIYAVSVAVLIGFISFSNTLTGIFQNIIPGFENWIVPLMTSIIGVGVGILIWNKLHESDVLKYEFVTTVTHKFRTPLTHIKWATENLAKPQSEAERNEQLSYIESANTKLVELTNVLMNVSDTEASVYDYRRERNDLSAVASEVIDSLQPQFAAKHIHVVRNLAKDAWARFDSERVRFIIQTFLENAINYSSRDAAINVMVKTTGNEITCSVIDNGIGIAKEDVSRLFEKFYRGRGARLADTEGMGIGLFIAKEIITRHGGRIWTESAGPGKGSTFSFALPAAK